MNSLNENTKIIYVGLDVHKDTYSACSFDVRNQEYFGQTKMKATSRNVINYLERISKRYNDEVMIVAGYEAGPTGYDLYRDIQNAGYGCTVIAPTTIRKSNSKVKTDAKDAKLLAETLAYHTYSPVAVPDQKILAMKEYTRARNSKKAKLTKAKQELLSFMLRTGKVYQKKANESYWTVKHFDWLKEIKYEDYWLQESYDTYLKSIQELMTEIKIMDDKIRMMSEDELIKDKVDRLICFSGIDVMIAVSIIVEIFEFTRFQSAAAFSHFLGLCPSEDSSGQKEKRGKITKAGNCNVRKLMTEAAQSIKQTKAVKSKRIIQRQMGSDTKVIAYTDRGVKRIRTKMKAMEMRGVKSNVATIAGARELSCFIWGMMTDNIA